MRSAGSSMRCKANHATAPAATRISSSFEAAGKILDLLMAVGVGIVNRASREPYAKESDHRRDQIDERLGGLGEQADGVGQPIGGRHHEHCYHRGSDGQNQGILGLRDGFGHPTFLCYLPSIKSPMAAWSRRILPSLSFPLFSARPYHGRISSYSRHRLGRPYRASGRSRIARAATRSVVLTACRRRGWTMPSSAASPTPPRAERPLSA